MNEIITGILKKADEKVFVEEANGKQHFSDKRIWDGYVHHWEGKEVSARFLPERDYETKQKIIIMWPKKIQRARPMLSFIMQNAW